MKADSLSLKVYEEIRRKILSNQLPAGTRLKEDVWARKMEVNRMAVRESLTRLLGERLVATGEKGGYFVTALTATDVHQIRELREILEIGALRLIIKKADKKSWEKLEKICEDFTNMVKAGYFNGALEADIKFHETLIECSENKKLLEAYRASHIPLFHQKLGKAQVDLDDYQQTDEEHRKILKAIKKKNFALAEEALIQHFARGEAYVLDM
ncbi:MAG TPA: GntR family transcriptional regulator [Chitinophagaceae bacterium]|nr:GntR family transcriptional regulator [Chitinophagaceae bacterium]